MSAPKGTERCIGYDGFGRIRYRSPAKARKAAIRTRGFVSARLHVYKCPRCAGWHLTRRAQR